MAVCEMQEQEGGRREVREKQEEVKVAINGNQEEEIDDINNPQEVEAEEERKKDGQEKTVSLVEDPVKETAEKREEEREQLKDEGNQSVEEVEGQETDKRTNEMLKDLTREQQGEDQEEKDKEVTDSLNKVTKLNRPHHNTAEEQQEQEDNLKPTASQSLIVDSEPLTHQENRHEEAAKTEEREMRKTPSPPKVLSAVARFQCQAHSPSQTRDKELAETRRPCNIFQSREKAQTHPLCESNTSEENNCSEGHEEEDSPSIKVSELKKRFEA